MPKSRPTVEAAWVKFIHKICFQDNQGLLSLAGTETLIIGIWAHFHGGHADPRGRCAVCGSKAIHVTKISFPKCPAKS